MPFWYDYCGKIKNTFFIPIQFSFFGKALPKSGVFLMKERGFNMDGAKTIYCPRCGRVACHYDGRQTINPRGKCKKCNKLVVYDIKSDEVSVKNLQMRSCSSGKTFV